MCIISNINGIKWLILYNFNRHISIYSEIIHVYIMQPIMFHHVNFYFITCQFNAQLSFLGITTEYIKLKYLKRNDIQIQIQQNLMS